MLLQELRVACELGSEQTLSRAKDKVDAVLNADWIVDLSDPCFAHAHELRTHSLASSCQHPDLCPARSLLYVLPLLFRFNF
jgi:hypothetical protein